MNRTVSYCVLACAVVAWLILSVATPWVLSDENSFLKGFVSHELLSFVGVLVTITLASAANLHLSLNRLEEDASARGIAQPGFPKTRREVWVSAVFLLWLLAASILVVVVKPLALLGGASQFRESMFNGLALLILLISVLILVDLTRVAFKIPPRLGKKD